MWVTWIDTVEENKDGMPDKEVVQMEKEEKEG
jgi:hypothetical protein